MEVIICGLSDTHFAFENMQLPEADIYVHAGDFSIGRGGIDRVNEFYNWLRKAAPDALKIITPGNHDNPNGVELLAARINDLSDVHSKLLIHEYFEDSYSGLTFFASPYGLYLDAPNPSHRCYGKTEEEMVELWRDVAAKNISPDVLITHSPPAGHMDFEIHVGKNYGSVALENYRAACSAKLHCFGHVHRENGVKDVDGMLLANLSICSSMTTRSFHPQLFKFSGDQHCGWQVQKIGLAA